MHTIPAWAYRASQHPTENFAGGTPYLRPDEEWPTNHLGIPLVFICQFSLSEIKDCALDLPTSGHLQIFYQPGITEDNQETKCLVRHVRGATDREISPPHSLLERLEETPLTDPLTRVYYTGETIHLAIPPNTLEHEAYITENDEEAAGEELEAFLEDVGAPPHEFRLGGVPHFSGEDFRRTQDHEDLVLLLESHSGPHITWPDLGSATCWLSTWELEEENFTDALIRLDLD